MAEATAGRRRFRAPSNIYTVLLFMAFLMLAGAVGYVWHRSSQLYGESPFKVSTPTTAGWVILP